MTRTLVALTMTTALLVPAGVSAWSGHRHTYPSSAYPYAVHHDDSDDVAIAVLGGIVGGIILDRVLFPERVAPPQPYYPPPPSPYARGYRNGYDDGYRYGRDDGYQSGYDTGYYYGRRYRKY